MNTFVFTLLLFAANICSAAYRVEPRVDGCGGVRVSGGTKSVSQTVGQGIVGIANSASQKQEIGFWHTGASFAPTVPIIVVVHTPIEAQIHFQNVGRGTYRLYSGDSPDAINFSQPIAITSTATYLADPTGLTNARRSYVVAHSNP